MRPGEGRLEVVDLFVDRPEALVAHGAGVDGLDRQRLERFRRGHVLAAFAHRLQPRALGHVAVELASGCLPAAHATARRTRADHWPVLEAVEALRQEGGPTDAALLAVTDDVDTALGLFRDHFGHGAADAGIERLLIE